MNKNLRGAIIGGTILILAGILTLVGQFIPDDWGGYFGFFLLFGMGILFLVAGLLTRESGWFIPGGILTGLGAGLSIMVTPLAGRLPGNEAGWFLLLFAGGWLLITLLSTIFTEDNHWWALIPGGIIAIVGLGVAYGGAYLQMLELLNYVWPIALIIAGIVVLWRATHPKPEEQQPTEKHA